MPRRREVSCDLRPDLVAAHAWVAVEGSTSHAAHKCSKCGASLLDPNRLSREAYATILKAARSKGREPAFIDGLVLFRGDSDA